MAVTLTSTGITFADSTSQTSAALGGGAEGSAGITSGSQNISVPSGATHIQVTAVGAGGGAGNNSDGSLFCGGAGAAALGSTASIGNANSINVSVGAPGTAGANSYNNGNNGGSTTISGSGMSTVTLGGGSGPLNNSHNNSNTPMYGGNASGLVIYQNGAAGNRGSRGNTQFMGGRGTGAQAGTGTGGYASILFLKV